MGGGVMTGSTLRVLIVGAGLAGPCLAHGLRKAGIDVSLYERDSGAVSRGQGYRIHIAAEGTRALRSCLPPPLYELAVATSGTRGSGVAVLSSTLDVLHRVTFGTPPGPDDGSAGISVDRLTLRQVLLAGLDETVRFGAPYERFEALAGGTVRVVFADGSSAEGDLLVGADGAGSRVRQQLLPDAVVADIGQLAVFGKTPLTDEVRCLVPAPSLDGFSTVVGPGGRFMPLAGLEYRTDPAAAAAAHWPGLTFHDTRDYVMWVLGAPVAAFGIPAPQLLGMDGAALRDVVAGLTGDWHPDVAKVIRRGDPDTVSATVIRTAEPVDPWPAGPVTLMGDAIHCMVPAGVGAAVALRDAGLLARRLSETAQGDKPLRQAVSEYETDMLDYGFAAVAAAQKTARGLTP
jgi:2-polyprenyl-6-methoxyphenol hydroxylase-like FAD-dependent oxidoreductase